MKKIISLLLILMTVFMVSCSNKQVEEGLQTPIITDEVVEESVVEDVDNENTLEVTPEDSKVLEIEIDAFNFGYSKDEIRVKVGQTVRVIMTNTGGRHDFVIDELDVRTPIIGTDETTTVEFTVTEAGEFFYYCSVGSHRAAGMEGLLIVEE